MGVGVFPPGVLVMVWVGVTVGVLAIVIVTASIQTVIGEAAAVPVPPGTSNPNCKTSEGVPGFKVMLTLAQELERLLTQVLESQEYPAPLWSKTAPGKTVALAETLYQKLRTLPVGRDWPTGN